MAYNRTKSTLTVAHIGTLTAAKIIARGLPGGHRLKRQLLDLIDLGRVCDGQAFGPYSFIPVDNDFSIDLLKLLPLHWFAGADPLYRVVDRFDVPHLEFWKAIKRTKKGAWGVKHEVASHVGQKVRFILDPAKASGHQRKVFASASIEGAIGHYLARKRAERVYVKNDLDEFWDKARGKHTRLTKRYHFTEVVQVAMLRHGAKAFGAGGYIEQDVLKDIRLLVDRLQSTSPQDTLVEVAGLQIAARTGGVS